MLLKVVKAENRNVKINIGLYKEPGVKILREK